MKFEEFCQPSGINFQNVSPFLPNLTKQLYVTSTWIFTLVAKEDCSEKLRLTIYMFGF